ncbi:MAG: hypothetical protein DRO39_06455 [Thermoprotei archaeon]|nr:MAG: hypothetical protein DRO39_06455 [Thermoprotei archaeon]
MGVVVLESNRFFLVVLFWALFLLLVALAFYASQGNFGPGFVATLFLLVLTVGGITVMLWQIRREIFK